MPKLIENREEMKHKILRLLSVDGRMSIRDIAAVLKTSKATAYNMFQETVEEYDLRFTPEIDVGELWRYEFVKQARTHSKKEILEDVVDKVPLIGLEEYIVLLKFTGKIPPEDRVAKALGDSYMPQYAARLRGDYDFLIYLVAREYFDVAAYLIEVGKKLKGFKFTTDLQRLSRGYGFFPLRTELIKQFNLFDTYLNLLVGLNENGRATLSEIGRNAKKRTGSAQMLYAYERLKKTGILQRVTYYEARPKNVINAIIQVNVTEQYAYQASKTKWHMRMVKGYADQHNEYTFMCDISSPLGFLMFASFENGDEEEEFYDEIKSTFKGAELKFYTITKALLGHLGIRDFDMQYTNQYKSLERQRLVPKRRISSIKDEAVENPDMQEQQSEQF